METSVEIPKRKFQSSKLSPPSVSSYLGNSIIVLLWEAMPLPLVLTVLLEGLPLPAPPGHVT